MGLTVWEWEEWEQYKMLELKVKESRRKGGGVCLEKRRINSDFMFKFRRIEFFPIDCVRHSKRKLLLFEVSV